MQGLCLDLCVWGIRQEGLDRLIFKAHADRVRYRSALEFEWFLLHFGLLSLLFIGNLLNK